MELLAPAGDLRCAWAALGAGADALYLGVGQFNARRGATNIRTTELRELCLRAHLLETRVYLTLNIAMLMSEYVQTLELAGAAQAAGIDAVIVADVGLLAELRREMPGLRVHASTQMNCHASDTLRELASLGVARVTLARELSLREIETLAAVGHEVGVEVEVFGHGALCVCYSGQCLLSSLVGRRSANRGLCAQPCRLPYQLVDHTGEVQDREGPYLLSTKDLASIDHLAALEAAGVTSLKIEGRMKSAAYVAAVVEIYRAKLEESGPRPTPSHSRATPSHSRATSGHPRTIPGHSRASGNPDLSDTFNRALTAGYLTGEDVSDPHRTRNPSSPSAQKALAARGDELIEWASTFTQTLDFTVQVAVNKALSVSVTDAQGRTGSFEGSVVEAARTKAITAEEVREHLARLGGTPYRMGKVDIQLDDGVGLGYSLLHTARKEAIADYERSLRHAHTTPSRSLTTSGHSSTTSGHSRESGNPNHSDSANERISKSFPRKAKRSELRQSLSPTLTVTVSSLGAARAALNAGADEAHLPVSYLLDAEPERGIVPVIDRIAHDGELDSYYGVAERFGRAVTSTLGQLATCARRGIPVQAHWSLNVFNDAALDVLASRYAPYRIWLSPELSGRQIAELAGVTSTPLGIGVGGQQEVMVTELDLTQVGGSAGRCAGVYALRDRKDYAFPVRVDPLGRSHLYNSVPLDLTVALDEILNSGVAALRLDMECARNTAISREVARWKRNILTLIADRAEDIAPAPGVVTKGHFFRGVV
jgi:putative protease